MGLYARGSVLRSSMVDFLPYKCILALGLHLYRISIISAFTIYVISGRELFKKRRELRHFNDIRKADSYKTTDVKITSELAHFVVPIGELADAYIPRNGRQSTRTTASGKNYEQYSVNIASGPAKYRRSRMSAQRNKNNAALEANRAAWGYTKVALLFFVSLLITWVSSA